MPSIKVSGYTVVSQGIEVFPENGMPTTYSNRTYDTEAMLKALEKSKAIDPDKFKREKELSAFGAIRFIRSAFKKIKTIFTNDEGKEEVAEQVIEEPTEVAIVKGVEVPGIEKIKSHIHHAKQRGNTKGMELFLGYLAEVVDSRGHSIQDLLTFLSKCNMPIADDGMIVAYKTLAVGSGRTAGFFVDPHSRTVPQNIGSKVSMPITSVDPSRTNACSVGLHIASQEYISGYRSDEVFIVKIDPRDVVAVNSYDSQKMRVASYTIVGQLSSAGRAAIFSGKPIDGCASDVQLVQEIIEGKHVDVIHTVMINGPMGTDLIINGKSINNEDAVTTVVEPVKEVVRDIEPVAAEKIVEEAKVKAVKKGSVKESAQLLYSLIASDATAEERTEVLKDLIALKKKAKISWTKLGVPELSKDVVSDGLKGIFHNFPSVLVTQVTKSTVNEAASATMETARQAKTLQNKVRADRKAGMSVTALMKKYKMGRASINKLL